MAMHVEIAEVVAAYLTEKSFPGWQPDRATLETLISRLLENRAYDPESPDQWERLIGQILVKLHLINPP